MEGYRYASEEDGENGWLPLIPRTEGRAPAPVMSMYIRIPQDDSEPFNYGTGTLPSSVRVLPGYGGEMYMSGGSDYADSLDSGKYERNGGGLGGNVDDWWIWRGRQPENEMQATTPIYDMAQSSSDSTITNRLLANHATLLNTLFDVATETQKDTNEEQSQSSDLWSWGDSDNSESGTTSKVTVVSTTDEASSMSPWFGGNTRTPPGSFSSESLFPYSFNGISNVTHGEAHTLESGLTSTPTPEFWTYLGTSWYGQPNVSTETSTSFYIGISAAQFGNGSGTALHHELYQNLDVFTTYILASIFATLLIVSLVCNTLILFTILSRHYLGQNFFVLYVSLAASDLLASMLLVPVLIISLVDSQMMPYKVCMLISTSMVLATFVSMGSIVSISIIRWWQFYNFNQTRTHERVVVRLIILVLWVSGTGIAVGYALHNIFRGSPTCSFDFWTATLANTLPLTAVCVTFGFVLVVLVNYLTIKKIKKKSIYTENHQGTRNSAINNFTKLVDNPSFPRQAHIGHISSDVSSLGGEYNNSKLHQDTLPLSETYHDSSLQKSKRVSTQKDGQFANSYYGACSQQSIPCTSTHKKDSDNKKSESNSNSSQQTQLQLGINKRPPLPQVPTCGSTSFPPAAASISLACKPESSACKKEETLPSESSPVCFRRPTSDLQPLSGSESEPESEHLYQAIEPKDTQEEVAPQSSHRCPPVQALPQAVINIALPNAVESNYNITTATKQHRTTIINPVTMPPNTHTVNTTAWKLRNVYDYLPRIMQRSQVETFYESQDNSLQNQKSSPWPLLNSLHSDTERSKTQGSNDTMNLKNEGKVCSAEVQENLCAGYMADMSAPSSKQSTPHQKLNRNQRMARLSALTSARTATRFASSLESEDEEEEYTELSNPQRPDRSCQYESSGALPGGIDNIPTDLIMHPVRRKCVRTSHRLVAFFAISYLPLLGLQLCVYLGYSSSSSLTIEILVLITFIHILSLMAIHPSLYGYQSPILRNAIRKVTKKVIFPSRSCNSSVTHSSPAEHLLHYELTNRGSSKLTLDTHGNTIIHSDTIPSSSSINSTTSNNQPTYSSADITGQPLKMSLKSVNKDHCQERQSPDCPPRPVRVKSSPVPNRPSSHPSGASISSHTSSIANRPFTSPPHLSDISTQN